MYKKYLSSVRCLVLEYFCSSLVDKERARVFGLVQTHMETRSTFTQKPGEFSWFVPQGEDIRLVSFLLCNILCLFVCLQLHNTFTCSQCFLLMYMSFLLYAIDSRENYAISVRLVTSLCCGLRILLFYPFYAIRCILARV